MSGQFTPLATKSVASMRLPSSRMTPVASPLSTVISRTSAFVSTLPPPRSTTRSRARVKFTDPPTGSAKFAMREKILGKNKPVEGVFTRVKEPRKSLNSTRSLSSSKCWSTASYMLRFA